jgi:hypothetical protein
MIMVRLYILINHVLDSIYILDSCHIFCLIDLSEKVIINFFL